MATFANSLPISKANCQFFRKFEFWAIPFWFSFVKGGLISGLNHRALATPFVQVLGGREGFGWWACGLVLQFHALGALRSEGGGAERTSPAGACQTKEEMWRPVNFHATPAHCP